MEFPPEVTQRLQSTPEQMAAAWVGPPRADVVQLVLCDYNPAWQRWFEDVAAGIRLALGARALSVEHVGSTSVPGLVSKPILDVDVAVADTADELAYVPALERVGYTLVVREPEWHGHRMFNDEHATINLHVFPVGAPEIVRHTLFRDWLREHADDRELYAEAKRRLAANPAEYNLAKNPVIDEIYERIFSAT